MKLIEAINKAKVIEQDLTNVREEVRRRAARPSFRNGVPNEREEVHKLVNEFNSRITELMHLKRAIDYTNLVACVSVNGTIYSLHDIIRYKNRYFPKLTEPWEAMDDTKAQQEVDELRRHAPDPTKVTATVIRNYDPDEKRKRLRELADHEAQMDSALQMANAKVDLLMPPPLQN